MEQFAGKQEEIVEGVKDVMGGNYILTEAKKIWNDGWREGQSIGWNRGQNEGRILEEIMNRFGLTRQQAESFILQNE